MEKNSDEILRGFFLLVCLITFSACMLFSNLIIFLCVKINKFVLTGFLNDKLFKKIDGHFLKAEHVSFLLLCL